MKRSFVFDIKSDPNDYDQIITWQNLFDIKLC